MTSAHADCKLQQEPGGRNGVSHLAEPLLSRVKMAEPLLSRAGTLLSTISPRSGKSITLRSELSTSWDLLNSLKDVEGEFHENRWRVLTDQSKAMDLLRPYAVLHLQVREAKRVLGADFLGKSDPYFIIYVNDVEHYKSPAVHFSLNPKWDIPVEIEVYSPFTMVRIVLVDWDRVGKHDPLGFVEFRVAELIPGGPALVGWFEIRLMDKYIFDGQKRFRAHKRRRDDHPANHPKAIDREDDEVTRRHSVASTSLQHFHYQVSANKRRNKTGKPKCFAIFGNGCGGGGWSEALIPTKKIRLNGGHIHLSMHLNPCYQSAQPPAEAPRMWRILGGALVNRLHHLPLEDEWFACCFPRPVPQPVEGQWHSVEFGGETLSMDQMSNVAKIAFRVKVQILDNITKPLLALAGYIISWRAKSLSAGVLIFWVVFTAVPWMFLPFLPMYLATWLSLLRSADWTNAMFAHEDLVPLNSVGLDLVVSLGDARKLQVWMIRLITDHGGWVTDRDQLLTYSKRLEYGMYTKLEGTPSFEEMIEELQSQEWITWHVHSRRRCSHCSDQPYLEFWGSGAYREDNEGWICASGEAHCLDVVADQGRKLGRRRACQKGLHLGVPRYHCPGCHLDFCGECVAFEHGGAMASITETMMSVPLLGSLFDRVQEYLLDLMAKVDECSRMAEVTLYMMERLMRADEKRLARNIYLACFVACFFFTVISFELHATISFILLQIWKALLVLIGLFLLLQEFGPLRRAMIAYGATNEYRKLQQLRKDGGCHNWKFYTEELIE